jgi:hypothetical protein
MDGRIMAINESSLAAENSPGRKDNKLWVFAINLWLVRSACEVRMLYRAGRQHIGTHRSGAR